MAKDFAVIMTGGKQYKVSAGDTLKVEKLADAKEGEKVVFDAVLLRSSGGTVNVGAPHVAGSSLEAEVVKNVRGEKKIIFKYHPKTRNRRKKGHRQEYTEIKILKI
jgi:large subunit ribosomal protein L21